MEQLTTIFFYFISLILLCSSFCMIFSKKEAYYISFGLISLVATSAIFFLLNATFNGAILILISTILVIFLFCTILFTEDKNKFNRERKHFKNSSPFLLIGFFFSLFIIALINNYYEQVASNIIILADAKLLLTNIYEIGEQLSKNYIIEFKLTCVLLFSTIIGIHLISDLRQKKEK